MFFLDHLKLGSTWFCFPERHFHKTDLIVLLQIGMKCSLKAYVPFSNLKRNKNQSFTKGNKAECSFPDFHKLERSFWKGTNRSFKHNFLKLLSEHFM